MTDRLCKNCVNFNGETCDLGYTSENHCVNFKPFEIKIPTEPKEDRQYWLMTPGKNNTTYVARCFSSLKNLLEYAEKQRTPLNKIFALSARNLKLRLEVEDN